MDNDKNNELFLMKRFQGLELYSEVLIYSLKDNKKLLQVNHIGTSYEFYTNGDITLLYLCNELSHDIYNDFYEKTKISYFYSQDFLDERGIKIIDESIKLNTFHIHYGFNAVEHYFSWFNGSELTTYKGADYDDCEEFNSVFEKYIGGLEVSTNNHVKYTIENQDFESVETLANTISCLFNEK